MIWLSGIAIILVVIVAWPNLAWRLRVPFLWTNRLQWLLAAPARRWMRNPRSKWPRRFFLLCSPLFVLYRLTAYVILTPLRLVNALYFDVLLFWSVSLRDGIADLVKPLYPQSAFRYVVRWLYMFPWRLVNFIVRYPAAILQGLAMTAFDLLWPTLTLFHGTGSEEAQTIARTGEWFAGSGNYVGTGLYFGLWQEVAQHYARTKRDPLVIIARVTLAPCRLVATLQEELRRKIGRDGDAISQGLTFPWVSLEHWRAGRGWYEFCLVQPSRYDPTKPWRVRPLCTVGRTGPERLPGGTAVWPNSARGWLTLVCTLVLAIVPVFGYAAGRSGLLPIPLPFVSTSALAQSPACPDAPAVRLRAGDRACVAGIGQDALRVRSTPTTRLDNAVGTLYRGTKMTILDGPECADGYAWWRVQVDDGLVGWVAEGQTANYFIEPCD